MRITKQRIRRIIREEKTKLQCEAHSLAGGQIPSWSAFENAVWTATVNAIDTGMESDDVMLAMQDTIREVIARVAKTLNNQGVGQK